MKLQLLPSSLLPVHVGLGSWECPGWCSTLGCCWTYRVVKVRHPHLGSLIPFGVPTLHCICIALPPDPIRPHPPPPPGLSSSPLPVALCRAFPGSCSQMPRAPFSWAAAEGNSARALHTGTRQSKGGTLEHCLDII